MINIKRVEKYSPDLVLEPNVMYLLTRAMRVLGNFSCYFFGDVHMNGIQIQQERLHIKSDVPIKFTSADGAILFMKVPDLVSHTIYEEAVVLEPIPENTQPEYERFKQWATELGLILPPTGFDSPEIPDFEDPLDDYIDTDSLVDDDDEEENYPPPPTIVTGKQIL